MSTATGEITALLRRVEAGDADAHERLAGLVRATLKRIAANRLRRERPNHFYQTSDLVHEAYLRLFKMKEVHFEGSEHFFKLAAVQMRRILIEYARRAYRHNHGQVPLDELPGLTFSREPDLLRVNEILYDLEKIAPHLVEIVELRLFGGCQVNEIAHLTKLSASTVKRRWETAKAFIRWHLS